MSSSKILLKKGNKQKINVCLDFKGKIRRIILSVESIISFTQPFNSHFRFFLLWITVSSNHLCLLIFYDGVHIAKIERFVSVFIFKRKYKFSLVSLWWRSFGIFCGFAKSNKSKKCQYLKIFVIIIWLIENLNQNEAENQKITQIHLKQFDFYFYF